MPKDEFQAQLEMGLGRLAFKAKRWADADRIYTDVIEKFAKTTSAPEARYWRAAGRFQATHDHTALEQVAKELQESAPASIWAKKSLPWLH